MKIFLAALLFAAIAAGGVSISLNSIQQPSYAAFTTGSARVGDPGNNLIGPGWAQREPAGNAAVDSNAGTIQEQLPAAATTGAHAPVAEAVPAPEQKANSTNRSDRSETVLAGETENTLPASPGDTFRLVAILLARPEIKSVSDLSGKNIAVDDGQSAPGTDIRSVLAAAGATEVLLSGGETKPFNRLVNGEVSAAVLTLAYPATAEWFPEIAGFKIFRIPLPPPSSKARRQPAGKAAEVSSTRATQE